MLKRRAVIFILIWALVWSLLVAVANSEIEEEDDNDLDELLAVDEELQPTQEKSPEADLLSKAQRIIITLTDRNTRRVIGGNEFVLVLGYAPWCHRSAELMPHFAEAATSLREIGNPTILAKLDAERHEKAASLLGIKGFPTLMFSANGTAQMYSGGFSGKELMSWVRKKTGDPVVRLSSKSGAEDTLKKHGILVLGLFKMFEGPNYEEFLKAAIANNEIQFVVTNDSEIATTLFPHVQTSDCFIGLAQHEPERWVSYDNVIDELKILEFVDYNKFPLVTTLTELNSVRVYSSPIKLQVFVFADMNDFQNLSFTLQDVAKKFMSKILFVYVDLEEENLAKPLLALFGLDPDRPLVVAFNNNNVGSKYLLGTNFTRDMLEEFCSKLLQGTLTPFYKSDPIPDAEGIIKVVVGRTFDAMVLNSAENVLLEVHTPWCITCETLTKQVEKIAKHFRGLRGLTFAKIDASSNEHPKLKVDEFPTLLFYRSEDKLNPIKLSSKSSMKDLISFIRVHVDAVDDDALTSGQMPKDEL